LPAAVLTVHHILWISTSSGIRRTPVSAEVFLLASSE
jgi:hypothetical protein